MISATENLSTETLRKKRADKIIIATALSYLAIGFTVAYSTPTDMLDQHPWARSFVEFMSFIPYVAKVGLVSPISQVAQFFAAVMWAIAPVVFFLLLRVIWHVRDASENIQYGRVAKYLFAVAVSVICIWTGWSPPIDTRHMRLETGSLIGMALFGSFQIFITQFFVGVFLVMLRNYRWLACGDKVTSNTK